MIHFHFYVAQRKNWIRINTIYLYIFCRVLHFHKNLPWIITYNNCVFTPCKYSLILLSVFSLSLSSHKSSYPRSQLMSHGQSHLLYGWKEKHIETAHCWLSTFKLSIKEILNAADTSYLPLNWNFLLARILCEKNSDISLVKIIISDLH